KIIDILGEGNSPAYRGIVGVMIHDLQLANYGDHFPAITAEVAYDIAAPLYPQLGPIDNTPLIRSSLIAEFITLPFAGAGSVYFVNPLIPIPYVFIFSQFGQDALNDGTIYRVNTQTNQVEGSTLVARAGTFRLTPAGMVADSDGKLYFVQDNTYLSKL